jgi:hypothetical protein
MLYLKEKCSTKNDDKIWWQPCIKNDNLKIMTLKGQGHEIRMG